MVFGTEETLATLRKYCFDFKQEPKEMSFCGLLVVQNFGNVMVNSLETSE